MDRSIRKINAAGDRRTALVFSSLLALTAAVFCWLSRLAVQDNASQIVLKSLLASLFLLHAPTIGRWLERLASAGAPKSVFRRDAFYLWLGLGLFCALGFIAGRTGFSLFWPLAGLGAAASIVTAYKWLVQGRLLHSVLFICFTGILGLYLAGEITETTFYVEKLARGYGHPDTLYHLNNAQMIKTYGYSTLGLNGTAYFPTHFGFDWIAAQTSWLLGAPVTYVFMVGFPVIFVPFVFHCLVRFILDMRSIFGRPETGASGWGGKSLRTYWPVWLLVSVAATGLVPHNMLSRLSISWSEVIYNRAYGLGLGLSLLTLSLMFQRLADLDWGRSAPRRTDGWFGCLLLPILICILAVIKISFAPLVLAAWFFFVIRLGLFRRACFAASLIICPAAVGLVYFKFIQLTGSQSLGLWLNPGFLRWPFVLLLQFAWSLAFCSFKLRRLHIRTLRELKQSLLNRELIDFELVAALCLGGMLIWLFINLGGTYVFFSDFQRWVGLALLAAQADVFISGRIAKGVDSKPSASLASFKLGAVCILAAVLLISQANYTTWQVIKGNRIASGFYASSFKTLADVFLNRNLEHREPYKGSRMIDELKKIGTWSPDLKKKSLIYIPKTTRSYWDLYQAHRAFTSFLSGALTGIAMIDGRPDANSSDHPYPLRLTFDMTAPPADQPPLIEYKHDLCQRAAVMGASRLVVITDRTDGSIATETISCTRDGD